MPIAGTPPPSPYLAGPQRPEDLRPAWLPEMAQPVGGGPEISDLSARHEHQQPIADVEVRDAVRDHDNRPPVAGEAGHHLHHRHVQARVQTGRGLVQEQQRRLRQQLKGDIDALLLAAG